LTNTFFFFGIKFSSFLKIVYLAWDSSVGRAADCRVCLRGHRRVIGSIPVPGILFNTKISKTYASKVYAPVM
tara:strand:+ start:329 stop:544 length:216 start_codon:yes stop_codon:yes gene_type:complete